MKIQEFVGEPARTKERVREFIHKMRLDDTRAKLTSMTNIVDGRPILTIVVQYEEP